jgi:hypothetical protein
MNKQQKFYSLPKRYNKKTILYACISFYMFDSLGQVHCLYQSVYSTSNSALVHPGVRLSDKYIYRVGHVRAKKHENAN